MGRILAQNGDLILNEAGDGYVLKETASLSFNGTMDGRAEAMRYWSRYFTEVSVTKPQLMTASEETDNWIADGRSGTQASMLSPPCNTELTTAQLSDLDVYITTERTSEGI